jgi:translocation and assembly module TamB
MRGGVTSDGWEGSLQRSDVESRLAGRWRLDAPSPLTVSRNAFQLGDFCLLSGDASLCGSASSEKDSGWQIASLVEKAPLSVAGAFLPEGWSITGTVDGKLDARASADGHFQTDIELYPGPGTITFPLAGDLQTVGYERGQLAASTENADLRVDVNLVLTDTGGAQYGMLAGELQLPGYSRLERPRPEQALAGRFQGRLSDLSFVEALDTRLGRTRGRLELDVRAAGTVGAVTLIGQLQLHDAEADVPLLGIALRDIQFSVTGDGRGSLVFDGRLSSAPGQLTIRGESPIVPTAESPARFTIVGQRFQAANTPEVQLLASPNIEVSLAGERIELGGEIAIPAANIELSEIPETAVPLSRDAVFVGPAEERRLRQTLVSGRVRIVLGDQVSFRGFGFTTNLAGSLLAIEEPGKAQSWA